MHPPHKISGKLEGSFETLLASDSKTGKQLYGVLKIDNENGWGYWFSLRLPDQPSIETQNLSNAIRAYDVYEG